MVNSNGESGSGNGESGRGNVSDSGNLSDSGNSKPLGEQLDIDKPKIDKGKGRAPDVEPYSPLHTDHDSDEDFFETKDVRTIQMERDHAYAKKLQDEIYYEATFKSELVQLKKDNPDFEIEDDSSTYSVLDTNTVNSEDSEKTVKEKLRLQALDKDLQQQKIDRDFALKLQQLTDEGRENEIDMVTDRELENIASSSKTEKASSSRVKKSYRPLKPKLPNISDRASSSLATNTPEAEQASRSKGKRRKLYSDSDSDKEYENKKN